MPDIIAKFHVEVAVEDGGAAFAPLTLLRWQWRRILEDVEGGLAEYPGLRIVARHHSHADAQVAVTAEDVHGAAESRTLRPDTAGAD